MGFMWAQVLDARNILGYTIYIKPAFRTGSANFAVQNRFNNQAIATSLAARDAMRCSSRCWG